MNGVLAAHQMLDKRGERGAGAGRRRGPGGGLKEGEGKGGMQVSMEKRLARTHNKMV
jgi:hypothetical protein